MRRRVLIAPVAIAAVACLGVSLAATTANSSEKVVSRSSSATTCARKPTSLLPVRKLKSFEPMATLAAKARRGDTTRAENVLLRRFTSADPRNFLIPAVPSTVLASDGFLDDFVDINTIGEVTVLVSYGSWPASILSTMPLAKNLDGTSPLLHPRPDIGVEVVYYNKSSAAFLGSDDFPAGCVVG